MTLFVPSLERDLRLDLFRGLANWAIFFGHIPGTALAWLTSRNYGFSDGADLFVFISGYTATLVFGRRWFCAASLSALRDCSDAFGSFTSPTFICSSSISRQSITWRTASTFLT